MPKTKKTPLKSITKSKSSINKTIAKKKKKIIKNFRSISIQINGKNILAYAIKDGSRAFYINGKGEIKKLLNDDRVLARINEINKKDGEDTWEDFFEEKKPLTPKEKTPTPKKKTPTPKKKTPTPKPKRKTTPKPKRKTTPKPKRKTTPKPKRKTIPKPKQKTIQK